MPSSISSSDRPAPWPAFPWPLLLTLVFFAASEHLLWQWQPLLAFCSRYAPPYRASDPLRTAARIALLPPIEASPPVLLVGSSQILEGMECEPFEERVPGRTCRNLGVSGGTPLDVLFLADRIDERTSRRVLVTGLFPQTLHGAPKAAFSDMATLRCLWRTGALPRTTANEWINFLYGQMQGLSETLRMKDSLWDMWDVVGPDPMAALRLEVPPQPLRTLDSKAPQPPVFFESLMGIVNGEIAPGRFTAANEMALDRLIEREARRGNRIVVIDFPTRHGYETTITPGAVRHHRQLLERVAARREVVMVRREDLPALRDSDFHDFTHLRASGRHKVSSRVAEILASAEGGS
jgi:hypothetical protein